MAGGAYDPETWHDLFVAAAGAAAALSGLIFVAVSINLRDIFAEEPWPDRAGASASRSAAARELNEQIEEFTSDSVTAGLQALSGPV